MHAEPLQAIACHDARDWRRWPELFERYWHPERLKGSVRVSGQTRPQQRGLRQIVTELHESMGEAGERSRRPGDTALADTPVAEEPGAARPQTVRMAAAGPGLARTTR